MTMFWVALFFIWRPCAFYAGAVGEDKGHGGVAWFLGGLLFGPAALGDRKLRRFQRFQAEAQGYQEDQSAASKAGNLIDEKSTDGSKPGSWNDLTQYWEPLDKG